MRRLLHFAFHLMCFSGSAHAIILFGLDNSENQSDPLTGVPFDAVARVSNATSGQIGGSAVHLGDGWMLTADHVGSIAFTTFDGSEFYNRDVSQPTVQIGTTDMKLFRLDTVPAVSAAQIYFGSAETTAPATLIAWGRGRDPSVPVNSDTVAWSNSLNTSAKRWGENRPAAIDDLSYFNENTSKSYDQETIFTVLGDSNTGLGANEAGLLTHDSGSGMFQQIGGVWYLIGLAYAVEVSGVSTFGDDDINSIDRGDLNYFVRVSTYSDEILTVIPEPSTAAVAGLLAMLMVTRRRRERG